jgi:membrane protein required for beta-lactamase induction
MVSQKDLGADEPHSEIDFEDEELEEVDERSLLDNVKLIMSNKPWMLICGGITLLYYVVTGIQYWVSDYMITTLKAE